MRRLNSSLYFYGGKGTRVYRPSGSKFRFNFQTVSHFKVYVAVSAGSVLLSFLYNAAGQWASARARRRLHREAVSGLLGAPISFFDRNPIGKILNRFSADVGVVDKVIAVSHFSRVVAFSISAEKRSSRANIDILKCFLFFFPVYPRNYPRRSRGWRFSCYYAARRWSSMSSSRRGSWSPRRQPAALITRYKDSTDGAPSNCNGWMAGNINNRHAISNAVILRYRRASSH